jgi:hypothetical protein
MLSEAAKPDNIIKLGSQFDVSPFELRSVDLDADACRTVADAGGTMRARSC